MTDLELTERVREAYEALEISIDFLSSRWNMDAVPLNKVVEIRDKLG